MEGGLIVMYAIIAVEYDECRPETYRGVRLSICPEPTSIKSRQDFESSIVAKRFHTGDPQRDYDDAHAVARKLGIEKVFNSSSVDDYVADGGSITR